MKTSRLWTSLLVFSAIAVGLFGFVIATDRTPVLGLDLKGGLSVIYAPVEPASGDDLIVLRDLMRDQLEDFGIAEPDVRVEGGNVIVDLPGVSDQAEAFEAIQVAGIVELRPVIQCTPVIPDETGSTAPGSSVPGSTVPGSSAPATTLPEATVDSGSSESAAAGFANPTRGRSAARPQAAPTTSAPDTTTPDTTAPAGTTPDTTAPVTTPPVFGPPAPTTTAPPDTSGQEILQSLNGDEICMVGPSGATGEVFERGSAKVDLDQIGRWVVNVTLRSDGLTAWNALAQQCNSGSSTCPSTRLAIVLDGTIQSAPTVNEPVFDENVQISGNFEESEARQLAKVLNRGAFPVQIEQQRVETVSPTAGEDSLNAAVLAGLVGVGLMIAFMIFYYRKLSVVIVLGLIMWGFTTFAMASLVSNQWNYAFTIAGATGLIVSVGVTVDTYVVFFERIRDEQRHGRSAVNAAPRSFATSWKTILAADFVSLLAAFILFWLSVGSVKGFALYLGMTTLCDLIVFYFVTRPATFLLTRTRWFNKGHAEPTGPAIGATT